MDFEGVIKKYDSKKSYFMTHLIITPKITMLIMTLGLELIKDCQIVLHLWKQIFIKLL